VVSEVGRWWHNRATPLVSDEPPATWFSDNDRPDDAPSP